MGEKNTYRCPSWDEPITKDEIRRIEADYGPLANNLAGLAQLIREMDRIAPKIISLEDRIKVVVEPTAGAIGLRVEKWEDDGETYDEFGYGSEADIETGIITWQSRTTAGFLIRILASARKLRPQLRLVVGADQARDFYVDLHRTLDYIYHNRGTGLVIRICMQWRGVDGSVRTLACKVEDWQGNFVQLAKEAHTPSVADQADLKQHFSFPPGQVLFDRQPVKVGAGLALKVLRQLVDTYPNSVAHKELYKSPRAEKEAHSALRKAVSRINTALASIDAPYKVRNLKGHAYVLVPTDQTGISQPSQ
jgi:hypothetical protein